MDYIKIKLKIAEPVKLHLSITPNIKVGYSATGPAGAKGDKGEKGDAANWAIAEQLIGELNGINTTFTTLSNFQPESVQIYLNGVLQKVLNDFNTSGNNTIQLYVSPNSNENILINYLKL